MFSSRVRLCSHFVTKTAGYGDGMSTTGRVRWFAEHKGYGYLEAADGTPVYVHHSAIAGSGFRTLREGDRVRFEVHDDGRGPAAEAVALLPPTDASDDG